MSELQPKRHDRRTAIGGSDAGAVLGLNPWRTPMDVWMEKTGRKTTNVSNKYTRLGHAMEPVVADLYAEQTGYIVIDPHRTIVHPTRPIAGTPDRIVTTPDGDRILEIKTAWTPRAFKQWGVEGSDQVPEHYKVQGLIYCALFDLPIVDFALFANGEFRIYTVPRSEQETELLDTLSSWWDAYVVTDTPPPVTSAADLDVLKSRWSQSTGEILRAGPNVQQIARNYAVAVREADAASEKADYLKALLQEAIGPSDGVEADDFRCTWKFAKGSNRTDWEAVARACNASPELIAEHTKQSQGSRRFFFKELT